MFSSCAADATEARYDQKAAQLASDVGGPETVEVGVLRPLEMVPVRRERPGPERRVVGLGEGDGPWSNESGDQGRAAASPHPQNRSSPGPGSPDGGGRNSIWRGSRSMPARAMPGTPGRTPPASPPPRSLSPARDRPPGKADRSGSGSAASIQIVGPTGAARPKRIRESTRPRPWTNRSFRDDATSDGRGPIPSRSPPNARAVRRWGATAAGAGPEPLARRPAGPGISGGGPGSAGRAGSRRRGSAGGG